MTLDTARRMIEEKRERGMDVDAAVKLAVTLRQCTPDEAEQLLREYGPDAMSPASAEPQSNPPQPSPILQIDWGMNLKPGTHLTPEFTVFGLDARDKPLVYFPLDNRIQCEGWNPTPQLARHPHGWQFHQPLRLHESGQYLLKVTLVDPTPGQEEPGCYRCSFRVTVHDSGAGRQMRSLEITADGLTANLPNLLGDYDHVKINVSNDAVIYAPGKSPTIDKIAQMLQPGQPAGKPNETGYLTTLSFIPDGEIAAGIPYVDVRKPETLLSHAVLHIENHPAIHLISDNTLTFGRNDPQKNHFNDVPLEIFPASANSEQDETETAVFSLLNRLFSRDHALLKVMDQEVVLFDCRLKSGMSGGTMFDDQPLSKNQRVRIFSLDTEAGKPQAILFSKMLAMQATPYREAIVTDGCRELPEPLLSQLYHHDLPLAGHISAVKIARDKYLRQGDHAEDLQKVLEKSLKELPTAVSDRLEKWLVDKKYRDPRFDREEHLLVVTTATLGGGRGQVMTIPGRDWLGVQLRILNLDETLYIENTVGDSQLVAVVHGAETVLKPLRPIPIQSGMVVRAATGDLLRFTTDTL